MQLAELNENQSSPATPALEKRILLVDDHPGFRLGMAALIGEEPDLAVCGEAENAHSALDAMRTLKPDIVLLDISMPGIDGIELIKLMMAEQPKLIILVLSMHDESIYALRALRAGAKGYVMKMEPVDNVLMAIHKVLSGNIYVSPRFCERLVFRAIQAQENGTGSPVDGLSDRELEVLQLLGKNVGTRGIAGQLHLSVKTIETHRAHIKEKLGFKDPAEMVRFAADWVALEQG
ncbi:MAG TPA: response regulator transcription factor [Chthoniobacterales bacterium]